MRPDAGLRLPARRDVLYFAESLQPDCINLCPGLPVLAARKDSSAQQAAAEEHPSAASCHESASCATARAMWTILESDRRDHSRGWRSRKCATPPEHAHAQAIGRNRD